MDQIKAKLVLVTLCLLLLTIGSKANAQGGKFLRMDEQHLGVGLKLSTNGIGAELYYQCLPNTTFKLGYEYMGFDLRMPSQEAYYDASGSIYYRSSALSLMATYHFVPNFYATAGFAWFDFKPSAFITPENDYRYGDIIIGKDILGDIRYKVKNSLPISPYIGIGYGQMINPEKPFSVGVEIGVYYIGQPKIDIVANGMFTPSMAPEHIKYLENTFRNFSFMPVVKVNFAYKFYSF